MTAKPTVGQTLYFQRDYDKFVNLTPMQVVKVGRKYITAVALERVGKEHEWAWHNRFTLADGKSVGRMHGRLVESESYLLALRAAEKLARDQKAEAATLTENLRKQFDYWNRTPLSLVKLRRIKAIIDEPESEQP